MRCNMADKEIELLAPENLPLDLGELGTVKVAEPVIPDVYEAVMEEPETGLNLEAYIVLRSAADISKIAKKYGLTDPSHPELLVYVEGDGKNLRYIIDYELSRYRVLHQIPLPEGEIVRTTAAIGAEMYPEYFGGYPVPFLTPWGYTTRNKVIANGVYWLETERFQRGMAVAYPMFTDLSDGAQKLAERFDDGSALTNGQTPGYLFFQDVNSSVPLFELLSSPLGKNLCCEIDRAALMNAVYQYFPEYAAQYNLAEQAGLNDIVGLLFQALDIDVELTTDPERLISMSTHAGTEFIDF